MIAPPSARAAASARREQVDLAPLLDGLGQHDRRGRGAVGACGVERDVARAAAAAAGRGRRRLGRRAAVRPARGRRCARSRWCRRARPGCRRRARGRTPALRRGRRRSGRSTSAGPRRTPRRSRRRCATRVRASTGGRRFRSCDVLTEFDERREKCPAASRLPIVSPWRCEARSRRVGDARRRRRRHRARVAQRRRAGARHAAGRRARRAGDASRPSPTSCRPGTTTVGYQVQLAHLAPTPVGGKVTAEATLEAIEGRRLTFRVSVSDARGLVAAGRVTRVVVERDRFLERAQATAERRDAVDATLLVERRATRTPCSRSNRPDEDATRCRSRCATRSATRSTTSRPTSRDQVRRDHRRGHGVQRGLRPVRVHRARSTTRRSGASCGRRATATTTRVLRFPLPTIAAVNGPALAGGFDLAVLCDLRVAVDDRAVRASGAHVRRRRLRAARTISSAARSRASCADRRTASSTRRRSARAAPRERRSSSPTRSSTPRSTIVARIARAPREHPRCARRPRRSRRAGFGAEHRRPSTSDRDLGDRSGEVARPRVGVGGVGEHVDERHALRRERAVERGADLVRRRSTSSPWPPSASTTSS